MMIRIHYKGLMYTTVCSRTVQGACRKAFKFWISTNQIKRQPKTEAGGGFEDVEYEVIKV